MLKQLDILSASKQTSEGSYMDGTVTFCVVDLLILTGADICQNIY